MPRRTRNSNASSETVRSKPRSRNRASSSANGEPGDFPLSVRAKRSEHDLLVEAPDEFRAEKSMQFGNDGPLQRGEGKAGRTQELTRADIARAHNVETRQIVSAMIGERDARGIEHLQKEIPYQAMGFFDFVEEQNASLMLRENYSESSGAAGFISHEQLHAVQVEELGHIEAENVLGSEKIAREFQRQFRLPHPGRPEKQERTERFPGGLQAKLAAFENRANAGNDMVLPFDPGKQVSFEAIQVLDCGGICVHE